MRLFSFLFGIAVVVVPLFQVCAVESLVAPGATNRVDHPISLAEAIKAALEKNLEVKIERLGPEKARYNLDAAYGGYEPTLDVAGSHSFTSSPGGLDPQNRPFAGTTSDQNSFDVGIGARLPTGLRIDLGTTAENTFGRNPGPFENSSGNVAINLRQPILRNLWFDSTWFQIHLAKKDLKISEQNLKLRIMDVVTRVASTYYDLALAEENVRVQLSGIALGEQLVAGNRARVNAGRAAAIEVKQAEAQLAGRQGDLLIAQRLFAVNETALKTLTSSEYTGLDGVRLRPSDALIVLPETYDLYENRARALANRPDLLQARIDLEKRGIALKYQYNQRLPQLDVVGSYGQIGAGREFNDAFNGIRKGDSPGYSYGLLLSIPLGNRTARNNYKFARADKEESLLRLKKLEQDILAQVDDAVNLAQITFQRVDATRAARIFAEQTLAAEQQQFEAGKSTSYFLLQYQQQLTLARLNEISSIADYNKALNQLGFRKGTTLDQHQLMVDGGPASGGSPATTLR
ncbi:MAG: putative Outer rane efflux protein [Verrucomicrobiales bacterium]|nr:putative Outer rane efflux protein [Verrucomicrobiales bacterium]